MDQALQDELIAAWRQKNELFNKHYELVAELNQNRPVALCVAWTGATTSYHLLAVVGYRRKKRGFVFDVADPWKGKRTIKFDVLRKAYGTGSWLYSWVDFAEVSS